jgi:PAS domain S-box-containing protein
MELTGEITKIILENISDGVFTVDHNLKITSFNKSAENITGIPREKAIGNFCYSILRSNCCNENCPIKSIFKHQIPVKTKNHYILNSWGKIIPVSVSVNMLKDENGNDFGGVITFRDITIIENLRKKLDGTFRIGDLVTRSSIMKKLLDVLPQISQSLSSVLIQGDTGTGKELLAKAVHHLSRRKDKPFVAINCGALPDTLLESELFGYEQGAFTGANRRKPGRFAFAKGGTLFLDEIGEISLAFQIRLLRVLQEKTYEPLGSSKSVKTDVRIVCATNKNLLEEVKKGNFREDLFYRINVIQLDLPELKKRKEDVPLLIEHFIKRFNSLQKRNIKGINPETLSILLAYDYPGNIRELENIIERAFVLCDEDIIGLNHLPKNLYSNYPIINRSMGLKKALKEMEKQYIEQALKRNKNKLSAAKELGLHKSTLFRKINELGIDV